MKEHIWLLLLLLLLMLPVLLLLLLLRLTFNMAETRKITATISVLVS